jgi:DNA-binding GntR family transcriptional regulator
MAVLHQQVTDILRGRIRSGLLPPGSRVPGERPLAEELGVSRVTLRQSLRTLELEGLLRAEGGARWVPQDAGEAIEEGAAGLVSFTDLAEVHGRTAAARVLKLVTRPTDVDEAELMRLAPGAPVHELVRLRSLDGIPILVDHSLVPAALAPGLEELDFRSKSLYRALAEAGCPPVRAECAIESRPAQPAHAELLGLDDGGPVLEIQQVTFGQAGQVVQWCRSVYRGDRYKFRATIEVGGGTQLTRRSLAETGRRPSI